MKLINSSVQVMNQKGWDLQNIYKQIELAGRTCYKSEDKITDDSCKRFVEMLGSNEHRAMFEHGVCYLTFDIFNCVDAKIDEAKERYETNPFSKVVLGGAGIYVTTNLRVIVENCWEDDLKYLSEPDLHEKCYCAKFICSRAIANEIVRHRMSFAQESTRYCNYSRDKFDNSLTFIIPTWLNIPEGNYVNQQVSYEGGFTTYDVNGNSYCFENYLDQNFLDTCADAQKRYTMMVKYNEVKPQFARDILPLCLKTELVVTGFKSSWDNFFKLRCDKAAHPDIQVLANSLKDKLYE